MAIAVTLAIYPLFWGSLVRIYSCKDMVQLLRSVTVLHRTYLYDLSQFNQDSLGVTVAISGEVKLSRVGLYCYSYTVYVGISG